MNKREHRARRWSSKQETTGSEVANNETQVKQEVQLKIKQEKRNNDR